MKKSINFLIAAIVPTLTGLIYVIFEDDLLRLLAALPRNANQRIIVRAVLLSIALLILCLSYLILLFRGKYNSEKKKTENVPLSLGDLSAPKRLLKKREDDSSPDVEEQTKIKENKSPADLDPAPKEPIFHNNLLWLSYDPNPLCPRCFESDSQRIHMKLRTYLTRPPRYYCTRCTYATGYSAPPHLQDSNNSENLPTSGGQTMVSKAPKGVFNTD